MTSDGIFKAIICFLSQDILSV